MKNEDKNNIEDWDHERLEGLEQIRKFIDPLMSRSTFYRKHRVALMPYLIERDGYWQKDRFAGKPKPRYFTFKRLVVYYMLRRKRI